MLTAEGRVEEAYEVASATNNFPEICGRICPPERLCEGNCVIEKGFESVTIGSVEKYIPEPAFATGWVKPEEIGRVHVRTLVTHAKHVRPRLLENNNTAHEQR